MDQKIKRKKQVGGVEHKKQKISRDQEAIDIAGHTSNRQRARKIKKCLTKQIILKSLLPDPLVSENVHFENHFSETNAYKDYLDWFDC